MNFNLVQLVISVRSDDPVQLSLSLPLLGNEFAAACRRCCCLHAEKPCNVCPGKGSCAWQIVFGQGLSSDPSAVKRFQKPPLPFMFTFPSPHEAAGAAAEIECGLVVVGQVIPFIDMLLEGFGDLLSPLDAKVLQISTRDYQGMLHPLGDENGINCPDNLVVLSVRDLLESRVWTDTLLHIRLLSPLRLFADGHACHVFDFSRFARSLLRRVSSLAYYYEDREFACDYRELSRQADGVTCTDNHFIPVFGKNRKLAGITGYGIFRGDFSGLLPFLVSGAYVHAGKGASFGMGAYELQPGCFGCCK